MKKLHKGRYLVLVFSLFALAALAFPPMLMQVVTAGSIDSLSTIEPLMILNPTPMPQAQEALPLITSGSTPLPLEEELQSIFAASPSPMPGTQTEPLPTLPPGLFSDTVPMATPLPIFDTEVADLQPVDWLRLFSPVDGIDPSVYGAAMSQEARLHDSSPLQIDNANYYLHKESGLLLATCFKAPDLSHQKLVAGILDNLNSLPVYVPDLKVLAQALDLPIEAHIYLPDGDYAYFLGSNRQLMSMQVLLTASQEGLGSLSKDDFLRQRQKLCDLAAAVLYPDDKTAIDKSTALVNEMMWNDSSWELSIVSMRPYVCQTDWAFYAAGHHVKAIDMKSGLQYSLTTDLISSKVIGIAAEDSKPWMQIYEEFVLVAREKLNPANTQNEDSVLAYATSLMAALSGEDFSTQPQRWQARVTFAYAREWQKGYYIIEYQPADAIAMALDKQSGAFQSYTLHLEEDLSLRDWLVTTAGGEQFERHLLFEEQLNSPENIDKALEKVSGLSIDQQMSIKEMLLKRRESVSAAVTQLSQSWQPCKLPDTLPRSLSTLDTFKTADGTSEFRLSFQTEVIDLKGQVYDLIFSLSDDSSLRIDSLQRHFEIPEGAS